ncbi:MAG: hypothetical protein L6W00_21170 [Lentisphaeria bacterium]|nr:MAG: hypothetical protein L6W00_21170 [Lentisphaeria bacterium]
MKIDLQEFKTGFKGERCFVHARGGVSPDGREIVITTQPLRLSGCDVFTDCTCSGAPMVAGAGRRSWNSRNCGDTPAAKGWKSRCATPLPPGMLRAGGFC